MTTPLIGKVDNGSVAEVEFPGFYSGRAGIRLDEGGQAGTFACVAEVPYITAALAGTIDGEPAEVTAARKSSISDGMVVAGFRFTAG